MLGSIAQRAGLGLDVNYVGPIKMNRQDLRNAKAARAGNVSKGERKAFAEFEAAKLAVARARAARDSAKTPTTQQVADKGLADAITNRNESQVMWQQELNRDDPPQFMPSDHHL